MLGLRFSIYERVYLGVYFRTRRKRVWDTVGLAVWNLEGFLESRRGCGTKVVREVGNWRKFGVLGR
jgi:hypothetical protein